MEITKERLGIKAKGRRVTAQNSSYELQEPAAPYRGIFRVKNGLLTYISLFEKIFLELLENILTNQSGIFELPPTVLKILVHRAGDI